MIKINLYSARGIKKGSLSLPKAVESKASRRLISQAIRVYEDRLHPGLSKTKTRSEVALSTRKIYRQKGTGGARHGAKSAPIFVGGGKAHGPTGNKRQLRLSKKIIRKALNLALTLKAKEGQLFLVDNLASLKRTKDAYGLISKIRLVEKDLVGKTRFTFILSAKNEGVEQVLGNIKEVSVVGFDGLNAHKVFYGGILLVDKEALFPRMPIKSERPTGKTGRKAAPLEEMGTTPAKRGSSQIKAG